jgi:aldose 1-epimerase
MPAMPDDLLLRAGPLQVQLVPSLGGAVAAFWSEEGGRRIDWMRPIAPEDLAKREILKVACMPLVPYSGRIRDAAFVFAGRRHQLPRNVPWEANALHGNGWQSAWSVKSADAASAALVLDYDGPGWPWPYRAEQRFTLTPGGLTMELSVANRGRDAMPAGIGIHPWFPATPQMRLIAKVDTIWNVDERYLFAGTASVPERFEFGGGLPVAGTGLANGLTGWDGGAAIEWPERLASLVMTASASLRHLVIYSPPGEPYVCIEPVSHSVDAFNLEAQGIAGNGTVVLQPSKTLYGQVEFAVTRATAN